jgi:hypothetical protein
MDLHVVQIDRSSKESCHVSLDQIKLERDPIRAFLADKLSCTSPSGVYLWVKCSSTVIGSTGMGVETAPVAKLRSLRSVPMPSRFVS